MPALDYDYDYYEYRNGHRVNHSGSVSTTPVRRTQTVRSTGTTANRNRVAVQTQNRVATRTTSTRNATLTKTNAPKKVTQAKRNSNQNKVSPKKGTTATRKNAPAQKQQRKQSIDIPMQPATKMKTKPEEMTLKKPKAKQKTNSISAMKTVAFISVFFALFFFVCYRYSLLNEEFSDIKKLQSELAEVQAVNDQLQADIESKTDLTYVENYAKYQLGMQKPSSSQLQYVSVEKEDKITRPVTIDDEEELSWFEMMLKEIRKILD